jgi:hypothetical protein
MVGYNTRVAGTTITAAAHNTDVRDQVVSQFASAAARNSAITSPLEGMLAALLDVNGLSAYSGAAWSTIGPLWGALTSWTPTVSQSASPAMTVNRGVSARFGRLVFVQCDLTVASGTGTAANAVLVQNLPATAASSTFSYIGIGELSDTSAGPLTYSANVYLASTTAIGLLATASTASDRRLGVNTFTAALAAGDTIKLVGLYEAAADA